MGECTEDRFLKDVVNHSMNVIRDDGLYRHISFTNNGSSVYRFDLITWPGRLCIDGDCGTYVFTRITDMFEFFRMDRSDFNHSDKRKLNINAGYWGEKLQSIGTNAGYKEYSDELMRSVILEYVESYWEFETDEEEVAVRQQLQDEVLDRFENDESHDYRLAGDFESEHGHVFEDLWDHSFQQYTFHYLWCLYAIVYGIQMYDASKKQEAA